jgi:pilus assembly protein Flp/PilA
MIKNMLKKLRKSEDGATAIEYGLIAALVAIVTIGALTSVGDELNTTFDNVQSQLNTANTSSTTTTTP